MLGSIEKRQQQIIENLKKFTPAYTIDILRDIVDVTKEQAQQQATATTLEPHINAIDYFVQAYEAAEAGNYEKADKLYRKAIALDPNNPDRYSGLINLLRGQNREAEALPLLDQWVGLDPNNFRALLARASVQKKLGQAAESRQAVAQARPLIAADDWYNLACLESIAGDVERALDDLRRATQKPDFDRAWARQAPDLEWVRADPRFNQIVDSGG